MYGFVQPPRHDSRTHRWERTATLEERLELADYNEDPEAAPSATEIIALGFDGDARLFSWAVPRSPTDCPKLFQQAENPEPSALPMRVGVGVYDQSAIVVVVAAEEVQ